MTAPTPTYPTPTRTGVGEPQSPWVDPAVLIARLATKQLVLSPEEADVAVRVTTDLLYDLSGRQYDGLRTSTVLAPARTFGRCVGACGAVAREFDPGLPNVTAVLALEVNGAALDAPALAEVVVVDGRLLRLRATEATSLLGVNLWADAYGGVYRLWPLGGCCAVPRARATVEWGVAPPAGGLVAALAVALEVAKDVLGKECRLAGNVTQVTRQGVSVVLDPRLLLGVPIADLWLRSVNPNRLASAATVWSPDDAAVEYVV